MGDKLDTLGELYSELGAAVLDRFGPGHHRILLYAQAGDMWTGISLYHEEKGRVTYYPGDGDISEIVLDLWYAEPPDRRWKEMQFNLDGTKFHARNFYEEDLKKRGTYDTRRERAVKERFGDKPIYYPPWPDNDDIAPDVA